MKHLNLFIALTRLDRPIGYMLLFWPCLWGLTIAYDFNGELLTYFKYIFFFLLGSILMRSAGCIINDLRLDTWHPESFHVEVSDEDAPGDWQRRIGSSTCLRQRLRYWPAPCTASGQVIIRWVQWSFRKQGTWYSSWVPIIFRAVGGSRACICSSCTPTAVLPEWCHDA